MEREIGKVFRFEGKWLKVQEGESLGSCEHCYFQKEDCSRFRSFIGVCTHKERSDKKGVIFEDITYIPEENLQAEQPSQEEQQEAEEHKEREIGEVFEYEGKKLRVEESKSGSCDGCYFKGMVCDCENIRKVRGACSETRTDNKTVIFMKVTEQQPQELNLCEVLKYCPQGETFWSPMFGDVKYYGIDSVNEQVGVNVASGEMWDINADGTITIDEVTSPEIMLYPSREQRDWTKVKYEKKKELPRTWEEFCNQNRKTKLEYYIDDSSDVRKAKTRGGIRHEKYDRNVLPSKQSAEAHLAYKQLHQLRDAWREGWLPDWTDEDQTKYVILNTAGEFTIRGFYSISCFLAFQDEKRAEEFLECFRDFIEKAGDLI